MGGLCRNFPIHDSLFHLMVPTECPTGYWGYWNEFYEHPVFTHDVDRELAQKLIYDFNPLRQNIVLFMAAMNNEL